MTSPFTERDYLDRLNPRYPSTPRADLDRVSGAYTGRHRAELLQQLDADVVVLESSGNDVTSAELQRLYLGATRRRRLRRARARLARFILDRITR